MNLYDAKRPCAKCGKKATKDKWHGSPWTMPGCEHIQRQCEHCGFGWAEAPLDATDPKASLDVDGMAYTAESVRALKEHSCALAAVADVVGVTAMENDWVRQTRSAVVALKGRATPPIHCTVEVKNALKVLTPSPSEALPVAADLEAADGE